MAEKRLTKANKGAAAGLLDSLAPLAAGGVQPPPPPPEDDLSAEDRAQLEMMKAMGLPCGFDTTAGKAVHQSNEGTVNIKKKRTYRQYMNRRGGFNKPLQNVPG